MQILVILAHPNPASFNAAIAQTVVQTLTADGHEVRFHDLYQEGFDPVLPQAEMSKEAVLPPLVAQHLADLIEAEGIVIVHPSWWGQPPAILKGWLDRMLRLDVAYHLPGPTGSASPQGLLRATAAVLFTTSNTPPLREIELYGDPLQNIWENCIFRVCGVPQFFRKNFAVIATSTPAQRQLWLAEVVKIVRGSFPAGKI
ncbi:MAG: NAD(P)H-dependent oxidoreductase [Desulfobacca sp.]|uniref:NAD(P)H-dependent oxidoreductase n=1 Tax=Desulfobacca sp. TaxID=2067990 RepID=UPI00404B90AC